MQFSPTYKTKEELQISNNLIKVKTEFKTLTSQRRQNDLNVSSRNPQTVQKVNARCWLHHTKVDMWKHLYSILLNLRLKFVNHLYPRTNKTPSVFIPVKEIKTEEAIQSVLTPENIKSERNCVRDSNNINNNENCGISRIKFDPTVGNSNNLNQTKMETLRSETGKCGGNLIQLNTRKNEFAFSNSSSFAGQINDSPTSTTAVRRKIVFSNEGEKNLTKANKKITCETPNRLRSLFDVSASNSVRINTNFIFPNGCDGGVKPRFSSEEMNFTSKNGFEGNKRKALKAKRWGKGAQRTAKKMVISASSIPEKICKNWGVNLPSDKNTNLTVASYIRCRLSKFQVQKFRGRLEGEKISTLANVESGRKRRLSTDDESESQRTKRCRLTFEDSNEDEEPEERSILDFKKSCISKLEALEREWNEKVDLEMEALNRDYKRDLRQLQEQQSLENYTICLKHTNQVYNGTMENVARKHWKVFRQMQNEFLLKTQNVEKKRYTQLASLRNQFKETGEHIQTILDANEMLSDYTDTPMLQNIPLNKSPKRFRGISIDAAVKLVKENKIYDSFYTQEK